MKSIKTILVAGLALCASSGFALVHADETTTTTHKETGPAPGPGVKVGVPGVVGVQVGPGKEDCHTKSVTRTNGEGDSATRTRTNC